MRTIFRTALAVSSLLALTAPLAVAPAQAQDKAGASATAEPPAPKQVALTQKSIDSLIVTQKEIGAIEAKLPENAKGPDPKAEAQINEALKKNGFANVSDFADASYSVGVVLAGMDPETGQYIGVEAATKKQIDELKADKQMPPKEKKEALDELNATLKSASPDKPIPANIDLVKANMSKLNEGMKQAE